MLGGTQMRIEQKLWRKENGWATFGPEVDGIKPQLILVFGMRKCLREELCFEEIRRLYPGAHIFGCSTSGNICAANIYDDSIVITAVEFAHTHVAGKQMHLNRAGDSFQAGEYLGSSLPPKGLSHVLVLTDGLHINGSALLRGLSSSLPPGMAVTGGLAGDGALFEETLVFFNDKPAPGTVAILGFYGPRLRVGCGSMGGYDPFGPKRLITRATANVLYEMDGRSALGLYKKYLGEYAKGLPYSASSFPLSISGPEVTGNPVRSIIAINEEDQSLTFGGDIPSGAYARLMKANPDRLIDGATGAAENSLSKADNTSPELALLISCYGRRSVLKQRTEEELEAVSDILGPHCGLCGLYSYGEISPVKSGDRTEFHNQTMTITTFREV